MAFCSETLENPGSATVFILLLCLQESHVRYLSVLFIMVRKRRNIVHSGVFPKWIGKLMGEEHETLFDVKRQISLDVR